MSAEEEIKFKVPHVHQSKPEALNLENFLKIRFHYKMPQVIQDIINYLTDLDVSDWNIESIGQAKRKKSEDIIEEMVMSFDLREKLQTDPKLPYYKELEKAMVQFLPNTCKLLLEKYSEFAYTYKSKIKEEISKPSIIEKWPKYFGINNTYISQSFYNYLSGPKNLNITKITYLTSIQLLFNVIFK